MVRRARGCACIEPAEDIEKRCAGRRQAVAQVSGEGLVQRGGGESGGDVRLELLCAGRGAVELERVCIAE
jgi:hypothetical protein